MDRSAVSRRLPSIVVLLLLLGVASPPTAQAQGEGNRGAEERTEAEFEAGADPHSDAEAAARNAIFAASAAFSRAYIEGDVEALAELYTEDAQLLPPELAAAEVIHGREAAAEYFAPRPGRRNLSHSMRPDELRIGGTEPGAWAVDSGVWTNVWQGGDDGKPRRAEGRYLVIWRLGEDRRWRIAYDMWHRPSS